MTLQLGSSGPVVAAWQRTVLARFKSYALGADGGPLKVDSYFGYDDAAVQREYQRRVGAPQTGVVSDQDLAALGIAVNAVRKLPLFFTVEGHLSDMFRGPVADTATILEKEGRCHHLPTWYNNGAVPFDNQSGVRELARRIGQTVQDNGVPFPAGTPFMLGGFSQGMIAVYDFIEQYLMPGKPLTWRMPDFIGGLWYGSPCRATDSIAPWAASGIKTAGTHGLDPYRRFGLPGCVPNLPNTVDVYREGDIFAQNSAGEAGEMKAAVYQAVARGNLFTNPVSLAWKIAGLFTPSFDEVLGVIKAVMSGVHFLGQQPNPHYSPYDISGGIDWARSRLTSYQRAA